MKENLSNKIIRVSAIQMKMTKDSEKNLSNSLRLIKKAAQEEKADLIAYQNFSHCNIFAKQRNQEISRCLNLYLVQLPMH